MRIDETSSIWTEGPRRLREGLAARRAELAELAEQLKAAKDDEERKRLERQILLLLAEYSPGEKEIGQSLF
jgi:hypothetical protein